MVEVVKVKLCRGLIKNVQEAGLTKQLDFYLKLKGITVTGRLFQRNFVLLVGEKTGDSRATIYRKLRTILQCGFASRDTNGDIILLSYDKLFDRFGFSKKKENLIIFKVNAETPWEEAAKIELSINLKHQDFITYQKHVKHKYGCTEVTSEKLFGKLKKKERKSYNSDKLFNLQKSRAIAQRDIEVFKKPAVNYDVTLTCKTIANVLGFKSKSSGWRVLNSLEKLNMLDVERRPDIFTGIEMNKDNFRLVREDLGSSFYLRSGKVFKRSSNKVKII